MVVVARQRGPYAYCRLRASTPGVEAPMSPDFASRQIFARRVFLIAAWAFVGYNFLGTLVAWLAALPASNGEHGNAHILTSPVA